MSKGRLLLAGAVILIALALGIWLGVFPPWGGAPAEIAIGAILPLTGDGAKYGEEAKDGIDLAVEEINSNGGIDGKKVRIIYEDDMGTSPGAVNAFTKLVAVDKVPIVIGPMYSSTTLAVAPRANERKVILFTPSGSSPDITDAGDYVFRNFPSDVYEGAEIARFAYDRLGLRRMAILTVNLDYGIGLSEVFKERFRELGGQIVAEEKYEQGATDFRTQLAKIQVTNPDGLYLPGYYTEIALILMQAVELAFDVQFVSCVGFDNPKSVELAGEAAEGVIFARPAYDPESSDPAVSRFVRSFTSMHGLVPGTYAAHAYDATKIIAKAIRKGGYQSDGIKEALYGIRDFPCVTGKTSIDENGDVVKPIQIMKVRNGEFIPVQ